MPRPDFDTFLDNLGISMHVCRETFGTMHQLQPYEENPGYKKAALHLSLLGEAQYCQGRVGSVQTQMIFLVHGSGQIRLHQRSD